MKTDFESEICTLKLAYNNYFYECLNFSVNQCTFSWNFRDLLTYLSMFIMSTSNSRVGVYVWPPYSVPGSPPRRVAVWTPGAGLTLPSKESLFPDKFYVLVILCSFF